MSLAAPPSSAQNAVSIPSTRDTISQLESARILALGDATLYGQIVGGVIPVINAQAPLEIRRWGAEFLAETFASPIVGPDQKEQLAVRDLGGNNGTVLQRLREFLEIPGEDAGVVKFVVQAAANIYPLAFRHTINNPSDVASWQNMVAIKSNILKRMDSSIAGVRICCIKFVQRVVQTQTPGVIADPRRPEQNDISLALAPRDHPQLSPINLEAEASALLDRLLSILQDGLSDAIFITAMLNSLGSLIKMRASIAPKILSTILNFNPFAQARPPLTGAQKVQIKSIERTVRALLLNFMKKNQTNPLNGRIGQYLDRSNAMRAEVFEERNLKRAAPSEPTDGLDQAKRQRLGADIPGVVQHPPLPPGPVSYAQLYTLTSDPGSSNFDVTQIPADLVARILVPMLVMIQQPQMDNAINTVRSRFMSLASRQPPSASEAAAAATGLDEDDYEPDYQPTEDAEQVQNKLDIAPPEGEEPAFAAVDLGPFILPQPPPLTETETITYGKDIIQRAFHTIDELDSPDRAKVQQGTGGFNRLAATGHDRDGWITMVTRLATRASSGLEGGMVKSEDKSLARYDQFSVGNTIRESLYNYVIVDFRRRIDVAVSWLSEEWYSDRISSKAHGEEEAETDDEGPPPRHYELWALRVLEGMMPYLEAKDKVLIRFLSEIPAIDTAILERVKSLARDPERVPLAVNAVHYLILFRPPVRDICIDALEDLWRNYAEAKPSAGKLLTKWRPHVLQEEPNGLAVKNEA